MTIDSTCCIPKSSEMLWRNRRRVTSWPNCQSAVLWRCFYCFRRLSLWVPGEKWSWQEEVRRYLVCDPYHMPWLAMEIWSIWEVTKGWAHWRWAGAAAESMLKKVMLLSVTPIPCRQLKGDSHVRLSQKAIPDQKEKERNMFGSQFL